jgi:hypothetical protein
MKAMRSFTLLSLFALAGCGADRFTLLTPSEIPIVPSTQISTGAWSFGGLTAPGSNTYVSPIGGFYGAISVYNGQIIAGLSIAASDPANPYQYWTCLGTTYYLTATGTVSNGILTLDSDFAASHLHLAAQLSTDNKSIVSGSYTITGACPSTAPAMNGNWNAPMTGTYIGTAQANSGATKTITATLTQGNYFSGGGYIPVDGTVAFASGGCTTNITLRYGTVIGSQGFLEGYSVVNQAYNDALILTDASLDPTTSTVLLDNWSYVDPTCGADSGAPNNTPQLQRK